MISLSESVLSAPAVAWVNSVTSGSHLAPLLWVQVLGTLFTTNANVHLLLKAPTSNSLTAFKRNPEVSQIHAPQQLLWKPALPIWEYFPGSSVLLKDKVIKTTFLPNVGEWLTTKRCDKSLQNGFVLQVHFEVVGYRYLCSLNSTFTFYCTVQNSTILT